LYGQYLDALADGIICRSLAGKGGRPLILRAAAASGRVQRSRETIAWVVKNGRLAASRVHVAR
jgi:hypothetical protein